MDNKRQDVLQKRLTEIQEWIDFSQSDRWQKLKARIEEKVIVPAKDAFWNTAIEGKSNEQLLRNTLAQRTTVRVGNQIIGLVEGYSVEAEQIKKELEQIEKHQPKKEKEN